MGALSHINHNFDRQSCLLSFNNIGSILSNRTRSIKFVVAQNLAIRNLRFCNVEVLFQAEKFYID